MKRIWSIVLAVVAITCVAVLCARSSAENQPADASDAGIITGKVVDKDGKPVEKAKVRLARAIVRPAPKHGAENHTVEPGIAHTGPTTRHAGPTSLPAPVTTDTDGVFSFDSVPPGNYNVFAAAPKLGMAKAEARVEAGQTTNVELRLEPHQNQPPHHAPGGIMPPHVPPQVH